MTVEEYGRDKKRLFSIMDKSFKMVLHKDEVSERVIQRAISEPRLSYHRKEVPLKSSSVAQPPVQGILALPGVQKIRAKQNKGQQKVYDFLVQNDGQFYTKEKLSLLLGYSSAESLAVACKIPEMVRNGWIEETKQGRESAYGTNMRAKIA